MGPIFLGIFGFLNVTVTFFRDHPLLNPPFFLVPECSVSVLEIFRRDFEF